MRSPGDLSGIGDSRLRRRGIARVDERDMRCGDRRSGGVADDTFNT